MKTPFLLKIISFIIFLPVFLLADQEKGIKQMVFEEQRIEGKIRRPQLVLIKAEQRPEFKPMVMQSFSRNNYITGNINEDIIDKSPYDGPFLFDETKIKNYEP
jgi:hypothetical protein